MHLPLADTFGEPAVAELFSERTLVERWLAFERALAGARRAVPALGRDDSGRHGHGARADAARRSRPRRAARAGAGRRARAPGGRAPRDCDGRTDARPAR